LAKRDEKTLIKLVVDSSSDRVLGAHMVGEGAIEIIQCLAIAVRLGATKKEFDATIGIHPSVAEEFFSLR
jgi:glutathione reductase (NADPH)